MSEYVTQRVDDQGIAHLVLCRPETGNAFDDSMIAAMVAALEQWHDDARVKMVVLSSQGKHFSAGADLHWMKRMAALDEAGNRADAAMLARLMHALWSSPVPVIARVQGAAYGGAVGLVACADIVIATEDSRFCLSEVKVGLIPAVISPYVVRALGSRAAGRFFLTAEVITASEARQYGLVHEVVAADALDARLAACCRQLLANSPAALRESKALLRHLDQQPIDATLIDHTTRLIARIRVSPEGQEGLSAFLEKRPPAWNHG